MIESMACGTPILAYAHGSVPKVVQDGVNGFILTNQVAAVKAARNIGQLERRGCCAAFEQRFTASRMAKDYLRLYRQVGRPGLVV